MKFRLILVSIVVFWGGHSFAKVAKNELKANYGFGEKKISSADIGLPENGVLKFNFSRFNEYKNEGHQFDEYLLKLAIQGLLNRNQPLIWSDNTEYGWPHGEKTWQDYYTQKYKRKFVTLEGGLKELLDRTSHVFNGIILYEPEPSDNYFLAANLANINCCLPVSTRIYEKYKASFKDLSIIYSIKKNAMTRTEIYDWMIKNILPLTDRTVVYSAGLSFEDITIGEEKWHYLHSIDYAFFRKCFIFNLSMMHVPQKWLNLEISYSWDMLRQVNTIMDQLVRPASIFGWCQPEWNFCIKASEYGHYICGSSAAPNLSFHGGFKPLQKFSLKQNDNSKIEKPGKKIYIAFASNEGDNACPFTQMFYKAWNDPGRGKVYLNWAIDPVYAKLFPAVMQFYYSTRTNKDYFVAGPAGAGYIMPRFNNYMEDYLNHTANLYSHYTPLREIMLWHASPNVLDQYARIIPDLRGLTVLPEYPEWGVVPSDMWPYGQKFTTNVNNVPVIRFANKMQYWMNKNELCHITANGFQIDIPAFKAFLDETYNKVVLPHYMPAYGLVENLPTEIAKLDAALDHDKFEIIDYATMFHLARLSPDTQLQKAVPLQKSGTDVINLGYGHK